MLFGVIIMSFALISSFTISNNETAKSVYDFKVKTIDEEEISLSKYKGKVLLIVNVASECGFTGQYEGLQKLYEDYSEKGLVVLGFPCNQFGNQEPGTNKEIKSFCSTKYGVSFPMFDKIDVNGENAHPLYVYMKKVAAGDDEPKDIKWNFTKFLIDKEGKVINRYSTTVKPKNIAKDIEDLL